jgi:hypothetical protein
MTVTVLPLSVRTDGRAVFDVTTAGGYPYRALSPMLLGPVPLYAGMWSRNMENAWQFAKVYAGYETPDVYWPWAQRGWDSDRAVRYPMGRGTKPLYSLWAGDRLGYVTARRRIYVPLYAQAVRMHALDTYLQLRSLACQGDVVLRDFDAYDHRALGYSWDDVMDDPDRKMGHGFVLAMMIERYL